VAPDRGTGPHLDARDLRRECDPHAAGEVDSTKVLAQADLEQLGETIKATLEKAKADDPRELRRQISELKQASAHHQAANVHKKAPEAHKPLLTEADRALLENSARR